MKKKEKIAHFVDQRFQRVESDPEARLVGVGHVVFGVPVDFHVRILGERLAHLVVGQHAWLHRVLARLSCARLRAHLVRLFVAKHRKRTRIRRYAQI